MNKDEELRSMQNSTHINMHKRYFTENCLEAALENFQRIHN